jgi:GTPase SAR1 family protein
MSGMINGGIFGPKLSGKTTLAMALSKSYWTRYKMRTLVLDPFVDTWGDQAWVTNNEVLFWENVWKSQNSLIVVDEAASTIRRDKELIPVFTALRHNHHRLIVIGHSGMN